MFKRLLLLVLLLVLPLVTYAQNLPHYIDTVQSIRGDAISGASVTVYNTGTLTKPTIYSTPYLDGPIKGNPLTTNNRGAFDFYIEDGSYDIAISRIGIDDYVISDVYISKVRDSYYKVDNTSANTIEDYPVGGYGLIVFDCDSNVTINSFRAGSPATKFDGQRLVLVNKSSSYTVTLSGSNTFFKIDPSGSDVVLSENDTITLICSSNIWYKTGFGNN